MTSQFEVTTTDASGHTVTSTPSDETSIATSTGTDGKVYTQTIVVHNTGSTQSSVSGSSSVSFFDNTGAVAGTFVVVGLVVTSAVLAFIVFMLRRRRRQRLDRDVAAAAAAAAAAASSRHFDDEEDHERPAVMSQYGGYYAATAGGDLLNHPQQEMEKYGYEDPAGGYDPYAHELHTMPVAGDRASTATAPGMAGFGAHAAQQNFVNNYEELQQQNHADDVAGQQRQPPRTSNGYFFDPSQAYQFGDNEQDAYGGYDDGAHQPMHRRSGSEGSVTGGGEARGLKVTNV